MKRIFTSAFILLMTVGAVNAQTISNPTDGKKVEKHKMKEHGGREFKKLNLTADQKSKLKSLHESQKQQMNDLKAQKLSQADFQAKRKALHEQFRSQMESILTPEQKAQLAQSKTEWKEKGKDANGKFKAKGEGDRAGFDGQRPEGGRPGFGGRGGDFQKELNLTADQQQKMQQLRADFRPKLEALRNDQSLTQEQKRAKMQELMKQQRDQMKNILTKEQQDKMESLRKERFNKDSK